MDQWGRFDCHIWSQSTALGHLPGLSAISRRMAGAAKPRGAPGATLVGLLVFDKHNGLECVECALVCSDDPDGHVPV